MPDALQKTWKGIYRNELIRKGVAGMPGMARRRQRRDAQQIEKNARREGD